MLQELKFQLSAALLTVLTIAAAIAAGVNFEQNHKFRLPDDGVIWREVSGKVIAARVVSNGPGEKAGVRANDELQSIQGVPVHRLEDVPKLLAGVGAWGNALYILRRDGVSGV